MATDAQIQRRTGTIYGEMLRESVSLPYGRFIFGHTLASQLVEHGVKSEHGVNGSDFEELLKDIAQSGDYGNSDNVFTRVQVLRKGSGSGNHLYGHHYDTTYVHNQWKELAMGLPLFDVFLFRDMHRDVIGAVAFMSLLNNPKDGVERLQRIYTSFMRLPTTLRNEFLSMVDSYPCNLHHHIRNTRPFSYNPDEMRESLITFNKISPYMQDILLRMRAAIFELGGEHQRNLEVAIDLLSLHNICVAKGGIVAEEIGDLVRFNTTNIPTEWESATLDRRVITAERITELNEMFSRQSASAR